MVDISKKRGVRIITFSFKVFNNKNIALIYINNQARGGYMSGVGYVTSGGTIHPTSNPYYVPGTGNSPWGGSYSNVVQNPSTGKWEIAG